MLKSRHSARNAACLTLLVVAALVAPAAAQLAALTTELIVASASLGVPTAPSAAYLCTYITSAKAAGIKLLAFAEGVLDEALAGDVVTCAGAAGVNVVLPVYALDKKGKPAGQSTIFISDGKTASRKSVLNKQGGTGKDLFTVDMEGLGRVCSLLGDENFNLLARYSLYNDACEYLVAPTTLTSRVWTAHAKSVAREGRMYVITVGQVDPAATLVGGEAKDGGALIVDPDGLNVAGPIYSKGLLAENQLCSPSPMLYSVDWGKDGCKLMDAGWATNVPCILTDVGTDGGFMLAAKTTRINVLNKKTYQDNVGNYHSKWVWQVQKSMK